MPETKKILGQLDAPMAALTDFYTVPANTQVVSSSIVVCNRDPNNACSFRLSVAKGGAADDLKQYLYYGLICPQAQTFIATIGITLSAGDVVRGWSELGNMSFNLFGVEIT